MVKMGVKRKRPRGTWRVGERGRRGAVQGGDAWFPNWVIDILQHIDLMRNSNCALHVGFWFYLSFFYLFVLFFCNQIGLIRYTSCVFRGMEEWCIRPACMTLCA